MMLLKHHLFTLTFFQIFAHLDASTCKKGERVERRGKSWTCEPCLDGSYQPEATESQYCQACNSCDKKYGSFPVQNCTKVANTKCQCREGFIPSDFDPFACKCDIGSGLMDGACAKCQDGFFSSSPNSPCKKWKVCKSGVETNGTSTSDVTCLKKSQGGTFVTTTPTSNEAAPPTTPLTFTLPHEEIHTNATTARSVSRHTVASTTKAQPLNPSNPGNGIGMFLLIVAVVGLLLLTAVSCRLHIMPSKEREPIVPKSESLCRRPVEESGDGSLMSLKPNPEEP